MNWLGKLIGGTFGFAIGGPIGAVLGTTLGHAFDSEPVENQGKTRIAKFISTEEQDQLTFFVATFSMLANLAKADGKVSKEEVDFIKNFITQDLNLRGNSRNIAIRIFNTALNSQQSFDAFAMQFYRQFHTQPQMLELMIDIMLRVSTADGNISHAEENLLIKSSNIFKIGQTRYKQLKAKYVHTTIGKYYSILGCDQFETNEKLKSSYRQKVQEFHPDKIASKGLPEEFTRFAQNKFNEIQEAWEHIKTERKIK